MIAKPFKDWTEAEYLFEERAGILQFCGGMTREEAEIEARRQLSEPEQKSLLFEVKQ